MSGLFSEFPYYRARAREKPPKEATYSGTCPHDYLDATYRLRTEMQDDAREEATHATEQTEVGHIT